MELFKFSHGADPMDIIEGEMINGATSKMWVERYSESGEFEIISPISAGLRDFLPEGTMISHTDTLELMIVENHEITEEEDADATVKTTGRSFVSYLEQRIIGADESRLSPIRGELASAEVVETTPVQIVNLIYYTIHPIQTGSEGDDLGPVHAVYEADVGTEHQRTFKPQVLWERVKELLAVDDLGIRTFRRNDFGDHGSPTETQIQVYSGVDRSASLVFSWREGDLDKAQYLFTNKKLKNAALVVTRYLYTVVAGTEEGYDRRFMLVDASDLDNNMTTVPAGAELTALLGQMTTRGEEALRGQTTIVLTQSNLSDIRKYRYRVDFNVGDTVRLVGNFGEIANMRITEYTEIEDENGESSHPTLSLPGV
jgi:hypothetical protein